MVMALYYDEQLTLKEVGAVLELSESRVCQIHGQALVRLRAARQLDGPVMNEISLCGSDLLLILCAVVVSFAIGSLHRLGRSLARHRRAVDLTEQDVRELTQQCDRQQLTVTRLACIRNRARCATR